MRCGDIAVVPIDDPAPVSYLFQLIPDDLHANRGQSRRRASLGHSIQELEQLAGLQMTHF